MGQCLLIHASGGEGQTILPKEFQQVEYLLTCSGGYLTPGLIMSDLDEIKVKWVPTACTGEVCVFGWYNGNAGSFLWYNQYFNSSSSPFSYFNIGGTIYSGTQKLTSITQAYNNIVYETDSYFPQSSGQGFFKVNNNVYNFSSITWSSTNSPDLFRNGNGTGYTHAIGKIFYFKILKQGALVRDFYPCYCKKNVIAYLGTTQTTAAENTYGLYDRINNKFYINSGTGVFSGGKDYVTLL